MPLPSWRRLSVRGGAGVNQSIEACERFIRETVRDLCSIHAMSVRTLSASLVVLTLALSASLGAQWPHYREPDAPRLADGTINLAAPAPRFLDGRPDLTGVW